MGSAGENLPPLGCPQQTRQYPAAFCPAPQRPDAARPEDPTRPSLWQQFFLGAPPTLLVTGSSSRGWHNGTSTCQRARAHALSGPGLGSDRGKCFLFATTSSLGDRAFPRRPSPMTVQAGVRRRPGGTACPAISSSQGLPVSEGVETGAGR